MAEYYRLTHGELIDEFVERASLDIPMGVAPRAKHEARVVARNPNKAIADQLKNMSGEQLAELERTVA